MHWINTYHYSTETHGAPKNQDSVLQLLDQDERKRFDRFRFDHSRWAFATARWMVKTMLAEQLAVSPSEIQFNYSKNGKPYLADQDGLHFNLSHTDSSVYVAVSNKPVGVDIELLVRRGDPWRNPEAFLNSHVATIVNSETSDDLKQRCFTRYWCCMEALVKLKGSSLFAEKETFGKDLLPLKKDGRYLSGNTLWQVEILEERECIAIASEQSLEQQTNYYYDGTKFRTT